MSKTTCECESVMLCACGLVVVKRGPWAAGE